jgi:hypothetical protein
MKTIDKLKKQLLCNPKIKFHCFPFPLHDGKTTKSLSEILETDPHPKYFLSESVTASIMSRMHKGTTLHTPSNAETSTGEATFGQTNRVYDKSGNSPTIPTAGGGRHIPQILG